jgi:hypothetical protein
VFLPRTSKFAPETAHREAGGVLHTNRYHADVNRRLAAAKSRDDALDIRDDLRIEMLGGSYTPR